MKRAPKETSDPACWWQNEERESRPRYHIIIVDVEAGRNAADSESPTQGDTVGDYSEYDTGVIEEAGAE